LWVSGIRWCLRLIALLILLDFCAVMFLQGDGRTALIPPLIGSVITSLACWQDAASLSHRRLLVVLGIVTTICVAIGLGLELTAPSPTQIIFLLALLGLGVYVNLKSLSALKRRRMKYRGYFLEIDTTPDRGRL
jgi:uncharacterized membrane protein YfcA